METYKNINGNDLTISCLDPSISNILAPKSVKVHLFRPSARRIYTIVGKEEEHWTDPDLDFCSCKDYYFKSLSSGKPCYHLRAVKSMKEEKFALFKFEDDEYDQFVRAIIRDSLKNAVVV